MEVPFLLTYEALTDMKPARVQGQAPDVITLPMPDPVRAAPHSWRLCPIARARARSPRLRCRIPS